MKDSQIKVAWRGEVVSVQPRSAVWRYVLDNRTHRECGYNLLLRGEAGWGGAGPACRRPASGAYDFCVAISEAQQARLGFRIGDVAKGTGWTPLHPECEFADLYRAGGLSVLERAGGQCPEPAVRTDVVPCHDGTPIPRVFSSEHPGPPWRIPVPPLEVYA